MKTLIAGLLSAFFIGQALAEPNYVYHGVPYWYTDALPDTVSCKETGTASMRDCRPAAAARNVPVVLSYPDGSNRQVIHMPAFTTVVCTYNICADTDQVPAGNAPNPTGVPTDYPMKWLMAQGYYIALSNGVYQAHRHGTGPQAAQYPKPFIYGVTEAVVPTATVSTYDVFCSPMADLCDFEGRQVEREELKALMPVVTTDNCDMLFCYNDANYEFVVGRSPDGMLGQ